MFAMVYASLISFWQRSFHQVPVDAQGGGTDESYFIVLIYGKEGDLPPVVSGRLHADQDIGESVFLLHCLNNRIE